MLVKIINFIKKDVWRIRLKHLSKKQSFFIKQLRIVLLALRGFNEDKCQLRASALTFYSVLSVVPVVAMIFGIAKGFGFEAQLEERLTKLLDGHDEVMENIITFANSLLETTKGGLVAGVGMVILFWTVMKVLGNIEHSFNEIWEIKRSRTFMRKFSDYLSIMLIAPVLFIMSSSVTIFITTQVEYLADTIDILGVISPAIHFILNLLPYCLIWLLFTFIYIVMPNTKVDFKSAFIAGIIAGTIFQLAQWGYIYFQVGVAKYNAIYGSFAALPLFLIWMQLSWLIVLLGAEISFANQNVDRYEFEIDPSEISPLFKKKLALLIMNLLIKRFAAGKAPLTIAEISNILDIPSRIARQVVFEFVQSKILSEIAGKTAQEPTYQPAKDINTLTIEHVIHVMEKRGIDDIPVSNTKELKELTKTLGAFQSLIEKSPANKLLKDI